MEDGRDGDNGESVSDVCDEDDVVFLSDVCDEHDVVSSSDFCDGFCVESVSDARDEDEVVSVIDCLLPGWSAILSGSTTAESVFGRVTQPRISTSRPTYSI